MIKVNGNRIYINCGKKSNLSIGKEIEIFKRGEAIKDFNGRVFGYEESYYCKGAIIDFIGEEAAVIETPNIVDSKLTLIGKITTY